MAARVQPLVLSAAGVRRAGTGDTTDPDITQAMRVVDAGTVSSGTVTPQRALGTWLRFQVGGALTVADVTGWPAAGIGADCVIEVVNGGSATITWPSSWLWRQTDGTYGASPPRAFQASGTDVLVIVTRDAGATTRVLM